MKKTFITTLFLFSLFSFNSFAIDFGDILKPNENGEVNVEKNIQDEMVGELTKELDGLKTITKEINNITGEIKSVSKTVSNVGQEMGKATTEIRNITNQLKQAKQQIAKVTEMIEYAHQMFGKIQGFSENIGAYVRMAYILGACFVILLLLPSVLCILMYLRMRKLR